MKPLISALCLVVSGIAIGQDELVDRGREVYSYWCSPCHDTGPEMPGTLALEVRYQGAVPAVLEERTDLAPEFTKTIVRNGISVMPFFRKTEISDEDLEAIAAYLAPSE